MLNFRVLTLWVVFLLETHAHLLINGTCPIKRHRVSAGLQDVQTIIDIEKPLWTHQRPKNELGGKEWTWTTYNSTWIVAELQYQPTESHIQIGKVCDLAFCNDVEYDPQSGHITKWTFTQEFYPDNSITIEFIDYPIKQYEALPLAVFFTPPPYCESLPKEEEDAFDMSSFVVAFVLMHCVLAIFCFVCSTAIQKITVRHVILRCRINYLYD